ncbi:dihydroxyacetone synthase [Diplogelasinospora grovesii]|uniref:transketolase n=1 Tax=Diplogelasinospora grovesii TaxID=303347 RepID=A0AAN6S1Z2_9PEZI|nr:dihydroxyacetone synthase [Diplogelasinospora grovesii]
MAPGRLETATGCCPPGVAAELSTRKSKAKAEGKPSPHHDIVLRTIRLLVADLCQQFGGGHPGGPIGMAAIGVALWKYAMRYAPHTPGYFNRDRFVLSNGHACLLQYIFLHLTGYRSMTLDQLKSYHSERPDGICPGHPEIEHEGIEVTTGPLGQGVANAVGLAMATKNLAATYNRPGFDVVSNHTWCMIGDACLQEGVALEAISLAGHLRLNNLTIVYDNNQITCDGSVDLTNTEDVNAKMRACGWHVIDVEDGCYDVEGIVAALEESRSSRSKPTFINVRTVIGLGSALSGRAEAHGAAFGKDDVAKMKRENGFNPDEHFVVGDEVREFFGDLPMRGEELVAEWEVLVERFSRKFADLGQEFRDRVRGEIRSSWKELIPTNFSNQPTASRASSGLVFNPLAKEIKSFMVGTADLSPSVNMAWPGKEDFQHPDLRTTCGIDGRYSGRYIHYGVREHAMCAISNGIAAFSPGTFVPVTSSFFMFYLYAAPAVRMGALQRLQVIHAATHDSIGMGEDGPTHQPIELACLFRAMPNLLYIRPGDSEETAGAWEVAIEAKGTPSIISTSRHKIPQLKETQREGVARGAYVLLEDDQAEITLIGVGAELSMALDVAKALKEENSIRARVVSFPCWRLFEKQPVEYKRGILRRQRGIAAIVIEPYVPNGWERYADAGICLRRFGYSLPEKAVYKFFGFETRSLASKVVEYLDGLNKGVYIRGEFVDL